MKFPPDVLERLRSVTDHSGRRVLANAEEVLDALQPEDLVRALEDDHKGFELRDAAVKRGRQLGLLRAAEICDSASSVHVGGGKYGSDMTIVSLAAAIRTEAGAS